MNFPMKSDDSGDAYAAGFFDGEGCILVVLQGGTYFFVGAKVGMGTRSRPVLDWLHARYGGSINAYGRPQNGVTLPVWRVSGRKCASFLERVRPFLRVKRREADLALTLIAAQMLVKPGQARESLFAQAVEIRATLQVFKRIPMDTVYTSESVYR